MNVKRLVYEILPDSITAELRHHKHVRDLATAIEPEESFIRPLIPFGSTVLDIGANFGVFTKLFAHLVGDHGKVLAFEPVPQTFRTLAAGVKRLRLTNVQLHNKAVSNQVGEALMEVPRYPNSKGDNLYEARLVTTPEHKNSFPVQTVTVDSLRLPAVGFIKIDVEGHELEVLHGSRATLTQHHPVLMVEVTCAQTALFLQEELGYSEAQIISPSNQLFTYKQR